MQKRRAFFYSRFSIGSRPQLIPPERLQQGQVLLEVLCVLSILGLQHFQHFQLECFGAVLGPVPRKAAVGAGPGGLHKMKAVSAGPQVPFSCQQLPPGDGVADDIGAARKGAFLVGAGQFLPAFLALRHINTPFPSVSGQARLVSLPESRHPEKGRPEKAGYPHQCARSRCRPPWS